MSGFRFTVEKSFPIPGRGLGGGGILEEDIPALKAAGIQEVFGPGTSNEAIVKHVQDHIKL